MTPSDRINVFRELQREKSYFAVLERKMTKSDRHEEYRRQQIEQCKNYLRCGFSEKQLIAKGYAAQAVIEAQQEIEAGK